MAAGTPALPSALPFSSSQTVQACYAFAISYEMIDETTQLPLTFQQLLTMSGDINHCARYRAMNNIGVMYLNGSATDNIARDPLLARRYYRDASIGFDIYGMFNLGLLYWDGVGR
jgi:TPR repeat protein